jgi:hypothetical protein
MHAEVTRALNPDHIDTALQHDLNAVSTNTEMPIYQQVREAVKIIGSKCLADPVTTRTRLVNRLQMGTASTAAVDQMQVHYETVTTTVDEAATNRAREYDEDADLVYQQCQPPPTRQERLTYLQDTLDLKSAEISTILNKFFELKNTEREWDNIMKELKPMAEMIAGASERASKRPRHSDDSGGAKVGQRRQRQQWW